jgi:hypothetical protein
MRKFYPLRTREPYPINDAGVIVFIRKNEIMPFDERRQNADVGCVARAEVQRGLRTFEFRKSLFNVSEGIPVSSKQTGTCGSAAFDQGGQ